MDFGQHFLAAFEAKPSNMSSVPFALKDFIMGHIITRSIIDVNRTIKPEMALKILSGECFVGCMTYGCSPKGPTYSIWALSKPGHL